MNLSTGSIDPLYGSDNLVPRTGYVSVTNLAASLWAPTDLTSIRITPTEVRLVIITPVHVRTRHKGNTLTAGERYHQRKNKEISKTSSALHETPQKYRKVEQVRCQGKTIQVHLLPLSKWALSSGTSEIPISGPMVMPVESFFIISIQPLGIELRSAFNGLA
jgi:hypothetical protein